MPERGSVTAMVSILMVSFLGLIFHVPLFSYVKDGASDASTPRPNDDRGRSAMMVPGILLVITSASAIFFILHDRSCELIAVIGCGFFIWPLAAVACAGLAVPASWTLSCRFPSYFKDYVPEYMNALRTDNCDTNLDYVILIAWVGSLLIFSTVTSLLSTSIRVRNSIRAEQRSSIFQDVHLEGAARRARTQPSSDREPDVEAFPSSGLELSNFNALSREAPVEAAGVAELAWVQADEEVPRARKAKPTRNESRRPNEASRAEESVLHTMSSLNNTFSVYNPHSQQNRRGSAIKTTSV